MQAPTVADREVDPIVWRAIAGNSVKIPPVGTRVYYFPQGHAEHATFTSPAVMSPGMPAFTLCRVLSVRFLAESDTDEVYARIFLHPISQSEVDEVTMREEEVVEDEIVSFVKILTPSDANNGGGFSVPRFCADSIYPRLDFEAEPPVQNLSIRDIKGVAWEFRHIYRGTPRRHLLTTGWSKFVNSKQLVAGDSAVFMRRTANNQLYVGVRRAIRRNDDSQKWTSSFLMREHINNGGSPDVSWGIRKGRMTMEAVAAVAEKAARGVPFEVSCYPRDDWAGFVVKAQEVQMALNMPWTVGMRVKMAVEAEDSSRTACYQGTVSSVILNESGPWRGSPWRMLQITWEEPEVLQHANRVNPWQVECFPPIPQFLPPSKKIKLPNGLLPDGERSPFPMTGLGSFPMTGLGNFPMTGLGNFPMTGLGSFPMTGLGSFHVTGLGSFPMTGLGNSTIGLSSPSLGNFTSSPAGMQGARHDQVSVSSLSNVKSNNLGLCTNNSLDEEIKAKLDSVSPKLNIGSSYSDNLSLDSQSSVHFGDNELITKPGSSSFTKDRFSTFQLFGKVIHVERVEGALDGFGFSESDNVEVYKEIDDPSNSDISPNKDDPSNSDVSPNKPFKLFDNPDVQHE
ncbi:auxin response factor 17 [Solanum pennellii]|uniref:Auxin response factor n=1 Tax=Solanum pennellii TaxID=28526 RepID=A0ABM1UZ00_SOLPN|nr:auxin response factor 17 [Solanum pennellii]XP_027768718.1 auxin response factor 17 [Solanum pennellii]